MNNDRFDLEERIMSVWSTAEDIQILVEAMKSNKCNDETIALANSIWNLHNARCNELFKKYEFLIDSGCIK